MPAIRATANASGAVLWTPTSGSHWTAKLDGLKVDNQSPNVEKIELLDCFTTDPSKTNAAGATQVAEDFNTQIFSGKIRLQMTVPPAEFVSLGKEDLRGYDFLGTVYVRGDSTTSDCVIVAQYHHE